MIQYRGYYSNISLGKRKKLDQSGLISNVPEPVSDLIWKGRSPTLSRVSLADASDSVIQNCLLKNFLTEMLSNTPMLLLF